MKTMDELREFYDGALLADLKVLEEKRKGITQKVMIAAGVILCVLVIWFIVFAMASGRNPAFIFIPFVVGVIILGGIGAFVSKGFVVEFKTKIIGSIVHFIDEGLSYSPKDYISRPTFMSSQIFKTRPNRYKGDDLVSGKVGATEMRFCELDAKHKSGSGKNKSVKIIFKGLFFIADFNKHFRGQTVVLPDTAEKLFGRLGKKLQSMNFLRGELISLEDPEFEQYFAVYGDDQIEARYILSTSLMARIVDFRKKTGLKIHLSFVGSKIFVAISYTKKLFEPRRFKTLLDFGPVAEYFEDLQLAIGIVEDLNLNTRIWSKE